MLQLDDMLIRQTGFELRANWSLGKGQRLAIIGPSGGGKSTLLAAIAGFVPLAGGCIRVDGQDIGPLDPGRRPVSLLFQDHNLFAHLDVAQNTGLGIRPDLRLTKGDLARVAGVLARVGLSGFERRKPAELSGGQRQRVALARALLRDRPLLMLDEPFAALGPALKAEMLDLVAEITTETGATLLMVTHDPKDAERIAGLTTLVADGLATAPEPTAALLANPPAALRQYLG
ncbi:MAG: ATP-binding cassette domain-containing protein [Rhodobacteraceae bacterium]|nr:ATP-binding cassette domain-containing protein [Paracoccaceae bacterium]